MGKGRGGDVVAIIGRRIGKSDIFERVEVEIFLRGEERCMRTKEPHTQKERFVLLLIHESNGFGRDHAVGLFLVCAIRC